jgi:uncharacterized protein YegP (UPF0339 family)
MRVATTTGSRRTFTVAKFLIYADSGSKYRWRLVSSNGQTTATSGSRSPRSPTRAAAAEAVKKPAASADVVDE